MLMEHVCNFLGFIFQERGENPTLEKNIEDSLIQAVPGIFPDRIVSDTAAHYQ